MDDGSPDGLSAIAYHDRTTHTPESVRSGPGLDFENKPRPDKRYLAHPSEQLPSDVEDVAVPALEAVNISDPGPPDRDPFPTETEELGRDALAALCYYAAGITKEFTVGSRRVSFRAAACTGALYHIDLYPVVGTGGDLDPGVYHFDPPSMSLDVIRTGDHRGVLADATETPRIAEAPVTFVVTSTWWRNAWKYRERTFRHAFWDSGTVVANLVATAHAQGRPAEAVLGFADEAVARVIGVDPAEEAPVELVPVGSDDPVPPASAVDPIDPETAPLSPEPERYPAIERAWRAGTLPSGDRAARWSRRARAEAPLGVRPPGDGPRLELDPVDRETASSRPLDNTIRRRGSCREYEREPITDRKLATILDRACRGTPLDVCPRSEAERASRHRLALTDPYLIVHAVDGVPAGSYRYHPDQQALERLGSGDRRRRAEELALGQRLAADAAACLYFMTDIEEVVDTLGDRGYRACQFEAAMTAGRLYLATYAHRELGGTGLTFFDDLVTEFFSPQAAGQTPMFLYTLGRPA